MPIQLEKYYPLSGKSLILNQNGTIISEFEKQVLKSPHKIAIESDSGHLTYYQLNALANKMAHYFLSLGISNQELIGFCLERSKESYITMLAILKIGAAYVPLDTRNPTLRNDYIIKDTGIRTILTANQYAQRFKNVDVCLEVENIFSLLQSFSEENPEIQISPKALCYVIYTSGSTGTPKGVCGEHQAVINLVHPDGAIPYDDTFRIGHLNNIAFDASVFEIWGALLNGGTIICITTETLMDQISFYHFLREAKISFIFVTFALFEQHLNFKIDFYKSLEFLLFGGEKANASIVKKLLNTSGCMPKNLIQIYGPTETTAYSIVKYIDFESFIGNGVSLGKPIQNTKLYIWDENFCEVAPGSIGELFIGGAGVARGYLNLEELTKQRFLLTSVSDKRLYRTGDLVRQLRNGEVEFIDRNDNQVKIRGFRIELDEIKLKLLSYNGIEQCAVVVNQAKGVKLLVAYVVAKKAPDTQKVLEFLRNDLPYYMIPSLIITLDALPLTLNGKVDIKYLEQQDIKFKAKTEFLPRSLIEQQIASIWAEVLSIDESEIDPKESFFNLGGQSLSIMRMLALVKQKLHQDIPYHFFVELPTVETIARIADNSNSEVIKSDLLKKVYDDTRLLNGLVIPKKVKSSDYENVLLTGVTGFLGIYLLDQLLSQTSATIYCLVKAENISAAFERIQKQAAYNQLNFAVNENPRIKVLLGNLEEPAFGFSEEIYRALTETIDVIYHNGALVNHIYDYERLRAVNVLAVLEVIKFAAIGKSKRINYISTLAAATKKENGMFIEDGPDDTAPMNHTGYVLSKWVAESLLWKSKAQGLDVKIYRPGNITGNSKAGICIPSHNHILLILKACINLKSAPDWLDSIEMTPVDIVAKAIVALSMQADEAGAYHLNNPVTISWEDYFLQIKKNGFDLEIIQPRDWIKKIETGHASGFMHALSLLHAADLSQSGMYDCKHSITKHTQTCLGVQTFFILVILNN